MDPKTIVKDTAQVSMKGLGGGNLDAEEEVRVTLKELRVQFNQNNIDSVTIYLEILQKRQIEGEFFKIYFLLGRQYYESLKGRISKSY